MIDPKPQLTQVVINVSELTAKDDIFLDGPPHTTWKNYSGLPENLFENVVRKPRISRLRAAWRGVSEARQFPIVSHLPRMTAAVARMQMLQRNQSAHLAFSFNFTDLPVGLDRKNLANAFQRVDRFHVFSRYEADLYPAVFGIEPARFMRLTWTQNPPRVSVRPGPFEKGSYIVAVGGEGRDYGSLLRAARALPSTKFVIIARPGNVSVDLPPNVEVLTNLPADETWRIACDSMFMVVPLLTPKTCCGHITIVSSELLGIPLVTSASDATGEYTNDCTLYQAGKVDELVHVLRHSVNHWTSLRDQAAERIPLKIETYSRRHWEEPVADFLHSAWAGNFYR